MSARRQYPEEVLQRSVVDYLRVAMPEPPEGAYWFHPVNETKRTKAEAGIAKALGQARGVPDLIFIWRGRTHGVELKAGRNPLSEAQEHAHDALTKAGAVVTTCRSVQEVDGFLRACGVPVREVRIT